MNSAEFISAIHKGIPAQLPDQKIYNSTVNHAPKRKDILSTAEKRLAVQNALRYFVPEQHALLALEFLEELRQYGRIYLFRVRPDYEIKARPLEGLPHQSVQAVSIMMMIQNNLDVDVAQYPHEFITYGGNGAVFQNWSNTDSR
jgi:urocanate hydratase